MYLNKSPLIRRKSKHLPHKNQTKRHKLPVFQTCLANVIDTKFTLSLFNDIYS